MMGSKPAGDAMSDLDREGRLRVRLAGVAGGLAGAALASLAGSGLRQPLYDLFQTITPTPAVSRQVHVVVIDPDSLHALGGWPWSRFYLARLVEQIADRGAAAIGFDLLMPDRDPLDPAQFAAIYPDLAPDLAAGVGRLPSMDAVFAHVIGRNPVVLARAGVRPGSFDYPERALAQLPAAAQFTGAPPPGLLSFPAVVANLPILEGAALGQGLVNGDRDPDGIVRRVPLVAQAGGVLTPGFALDLIRVAEGATRIGLESRGGRLAAVRVGRRRIAATEDGQLQLRFADWRTTQTSSAVDVLRQGAPKSLFAGQIVIIGLASAGASDVAATPRAPAVYSVYVQAQAVDAILRGAGLRRPDWAAPAEWSVGLTLALLAWLAVPRMSVTAASLAALCAIAAELVGSWQGFQRGLLVDPWPMAEPAAAVMMAMILSLLVEGRRAQARLRTNLEDQRRGAEEHQQLLINELNHRVKNTLATVQAIALQTARSASDPGQFVGVFTARIGALARAHELLSERSWEGASLSDVIAHCLAPYVAGGGEGRVSLSGPPIDLGPNAAVSLMMAFHELATNAAKFGAFSVEQGRVRVTWRVEPRPGAVILDWRESGGPPVSEPARRGFGSRLLERALAREFDGEVKLTFAKAGVRCRMRLPLSVKLRVAA